jgi:hypothetical protein
MFGSVLDHIANLRHVKSWKTRVSGLNLLFWVTKVVKQPFYSIGPKMISGCVLEDFANLRQVKRCKTCVWAWMHYFKVSKLWSIHSTPLDPKWCFGVFRCISQTFRMWKFQNLCLILNALFHGTEVVIHPFQSIGPKMVFGRVSEHFTNLRHVKRWKTCLFGLNGLFRGTKVVNLPIYSIGPKMMFGSVLEHIANLRHVKVAKLVCWAIMHYFVVPKLWNIHSCPLDPKWFLGEFQSISLTFGT